MSQTRVVPTSFAPAKVIISTSVAMGRLPRRTGVVPGTITKDSNQHRARYLPNCSRVQGHLSSQFTEGLRDESHGAQGSVVYALNNRSRGAMLSKQGWEARMREIEQARAIESRNQTCLLGCAAGGRIRCMSILIRSCGNPCPWAMTASAAHTSGRVWEAQDVHE